MQKKHRVFLLSFVAVFALLVGAFGTVLSFAHGNTLVAPRFSVSSRPARADTMAVHRVDMAKAPVASHGALSHRASAIPLLRVAQRKGELSHARNVPLLKNAIPLAANQPFTPPKITKFQGMADSPAICPYFGGCQPPDMALAASPRWVVQSVNTSVAVYNTTGSLQAGWPKNSQQFFNIPNPPGNCDPAGPFTSDPRAFYDPNDGRFWVVILQVEGAFGIAPNCPFQSNYWVAVSQTGDPTGAWNVYEFDMTLGTANAADYTQVGFDSHAFYFGGNMFARNGSAYSYDEIFGANKQNMENGEPVTAYGFTSLSVNNVLVDTVQPVEGQFASYAGPADGMFINSFNINGDPNGHNCFTSACSGLLVWAMRSPGTSHASLSGIYVPTASYIVPPNADEPGCAQCIETIDTRITATPLFANGLISFALDTAVQNSTQIVPAIFWGQVTPQFINGVLVGVFLYQSGYFGFQDDKAASFGALMPDNNGDLLMVFDTMSSTLSPTAAYTARRVGYVLGFFHDAGYFLQKGMRRTFDSRWGDYEAASYDGVSSDHIWFASQYAAANGDWATAIGETQFALQ